MGRTSRADSTDDSARYTVGSVAERVGVPIATLRSWNQRYGIGPPHHNPGRHRLYSETDIAVVQQMHQLIGEGASPGSAARAALDSVVPLRADTDSLVGAAFDLNIVLAGQLLDRHLRHYGVRTGPRRRRRGLKATTGGRAGSDGLPGRRLSEADGIRAVRRCAAS